MNDRDVVIVEAVRTAVGRRGGSLSGVHPVPLQTMCCGGGLGTATVIERLD